MYISRKKKMLGLALFDLALFDQVRFFFFCFLCVCSKAMPTIQMMKNQYEINLKISIGNDSNGIKKG